MYHLLRALVCSLALGISVGQAQLAITEAMSSASTNLGTTLVIDNSDWWELTNFGTNTVDLQGYRFNDNAGGLIGADPTPFVGLSIGPGESIIFCESNAPPRTGTAAAFRAWWGLPAESPLRIIFYTGNGLSSGGDGLRLWGPNAASDADVVDSVDFGAALRGRTFTYNQAIIAFDCTVVPRGTKNKALAMKVLNRLLSPDIQAALPHFINYGPVNMKAYDLGTISPELAAKLPSSPISAAMLSIRALPMPLNSAWLTNHSRASGCALAS